MSGSPGLSPIATGDALVQEAAERAFTDLANRWHARPRDADAQALRGALLQSVIDLGFADALPSPLAAESWPAAASILRAQARASAPIDMAPLLVTGDRVAAIAQDPEALSAALPASPPADSDTAHALALARCLQICGAMEAALGLTLAYVQQRSQFGRPLARFQAIQHSLAIAAEEVAACTMATDLALACKATERDAGARFAALLDAAALVAGNAVDVVHDACHQAHGAIGFTREYALQRHSLDLLRWRDDLHRLLGGELRFAERLGGVALEANGVWNAVTSLMGSGATG